MRRAAAAAAAAAAVVFAAALLPLLEFRELLVQRAPLVQSLARRARGSGGDRRA